ncbi:MAG TPA: hypothetical protein VM925_07790 [Labilithrix sp.]|jgi:hypothetical protein|nr:hypothetical protein [Labilithrix sp.]
MELTRGDNTGTAADPQAIQSTPPQKLPLYDNDPTRNVSSREGAQRSLVIVLGALALAVMLVATVWMALGK